MAGPETLLVGTAAGVAVGGAASAALDPALEPAKQDSWKKHPGKVLDAGRLAELVAQGLTKLDTAYERASRSGWSANNVDALVQLALEAPSVAETLELWRRNPTRPASEQITVEQVDHALAKAKIEPQYWPLLKELVNERLSPAEIALAIIRGLINDPGFMPVQLDTSGGVVPSYPVSEFDAVAEAAASGIDRERLRVMVGAIGRPMSPHEGASAVFRNIIKRGDYNKLILEGDIRPEWGDPLFEQAREILSVTQYAESHLRGYTPDLDTMFANMAKHGMSREDAELLFLNQGRPLALHQITTGLERGGEYNGPTDHIPPVYFDAVRESNVKPPYYNLDYANRYSYPTGFMIKAEAVAGELAKADTEQLLRELGWSPKWATFFSEKWAAKAATAGTGATIKTSPVVKSQETAAITLLRKAYVDGSYDQATADSFLAALDHNAAERVAVFKIWDVMRGIAGTPIDTTGGTPH